MFVKYAINLYLYRFNERRQKAVSFEAKLKKYPAKICSNFLVNDYSMILSLWWLRDIEKRIFGEE